MAIKLDDAIRNAIAACDEYEIRKKRKRRRKVTPPFALGRKAGIFPAKPFAGKVWRDEWGDNQFRRMARICTNPSGCCEGFSQEVGYATKDVKEYNRSQPRIEVTAMGARVLTPDMPGELGNG
ncbi:hypothetical protein JCM15519_37790 [Fundidesulfovibrio butyratiphilus]